jgi:drug/metabolite transporter (DMT)-like permease
MPITALALLLAAAVLHATWNLLVKRSQARQAFAWWALGAGVVVFAPLLLVSPGLPAEAWPYVLASAVVETLYFFTLTRAYDQADFSLVYPLARGAAPMLLTVWALLFLHETPTPGGLAGLALLVGGLLLVAGQTAWAQRSTLHTSGVLMALATAACISVYTTIDGAAMRVAPPLAYNVIMLAVMTVLTAPFVFARYGRAALVEEFRARPWPIVLAGLLGIVTYSLVLQAYALARVGYAGAVREISVVFAALIGWRWLHESFGATRTAGAVLIFAGIVLIAVLG